MFPFPRGTQYFRARNVVLGIVIRIVLLRLDNWKRRLFDDEIAGGLLKIVIGSEPEVVVLFITCLLYTSDAADE